jgi:zinc protease
VQEASDKEDAKILSQAQRTSEVEPGVAVHQIQKQSPKKFSFPKAKKVMLDNGTKLLYYNNPNVPKVDIVLSLKAKHYYDPQGKEGLYNMLCMMLHEGTKNYTADQLAQEFENRGMDLSIHPGTISISCLSEDISKALELLEEIITRATLPKEALEKVRSQIKTMLQSYWDEPTKFVGSLIRREIYKNHPFAKDTMGTLETIESITHEDLLKAYKEYFVPEKAQLVIVGDIQANDIQDLCVVSLSSWTGAALPGPEFPVLPAITCTEINHPINRDQIVLAFAGKSVKRTDDLYDMLLLFDQIFTGGVLGSMSSRLFALREQSGLFYTIGGSLLANVSEEPGMIYLRTIVSKDRLIEAEKAIEATINSASLTIEDQEFEQARDALINSLVEHFESNKQMAYSFLFLERFSLPDDYFDTRAAKLLEVSKDEVAKAVKSFLSAEALIKIRIGRV